jgi:hypothetical protein
MLLSDLSMYLGFASAVAVVAILIAAPEAARRAGGAWARSPIASLPRVASSRLPAILVSFLGALVIFVALDLASRGTISSLADSGALGPFAFGAFIAIVLGNVTYFFVRRRRAVR